MSDITTALKRAKSEGKKIVGAYCVYAPLELAIAAGALVFGLCATKEEGIPDGEKALPRNFCPLIKSSYGLAVTDKCPFFLYSDIIIGETTCDGKKKMFELMAQFKRVHVMRLPSCYTEETAKDYWLGEVRKLKDILEQEFNVEITDAGLRSAITVLNNERRLIQQLAGLTKSDPVPISGMDMLKLMWGRNFVFDREEFETQVSDMIKLIKESAASGKSAFPKGAKRIVVTGVPTGMGADKVIRIIEECGAAVVYIDSCAGMKQFVTLVDENQPPLEAIAEKYLNTPCSCMSPNPLRLEGFNPIIEDYQVDGVIDIIWQGCHTYNVESRVLQDYLKKQHDMPMLRIETDYSQGDVEQIRTRIQAYLEMLNK